MMPEVPRYKSYVGPPEFYDIAAAMQFCLLIFLGLREYHSLLDIGCGSLRGGKLFIPYLLPNLYFGIEPEQWLIEEGIKNEIGEDMIKIKKPNFSNDRNFTLSIFNQKFDFLLAQSIFSHASQTQIRRCFSEAKKVMKPFSIFAATYMEGEKDYIGDKWVYPDCCTYTYSKMKELINEQNLSCQKIEWPHPAGQKWLVIYNPENEKNISVLPFLIKQKYYENELILCKERLTRIENHPYVKLG